MIEIIMLLISVEYKIKPILISILFLSVMGFCLYSLFFPITVFYILALQCILQIQLIENRQQIDCRWHLLLIVVKIHLLSLQALYMYFIGNFSLGLIVN